MIDRQKAWLHRLSIYCLFILLMMILTRSNHLASAQNNIHYINWNISNPIFKEYGKNIIDIHPGTVDQPWSYEQANIICPRYSSSRPSERIEKYIIYNVSKSEFEHCQVIDPKQENIVAVCNTPYKLTFFTLTFRAFSPVPGAFEFHPGENYYFISTSSKRNLYKHSGGRCATHNMRLVFRISDTYNREGDNGTNLHKNDYLNVDLQTVNTQSNTQRTNAYESEYEDYYSEEQNYISKERDRPEAVQSNACKSQLFTSSVINLFLVVYLFSRLFL